MQLMTKRDEVLEVLEQAQQTRCPLFCPNVETPDEIEGLLLGTMDFQKHSGLKEVVMGVGIIRTKQAH